MQKNKTVENLMTAFAGEAQANRKYMAYAKKAEAEGRANVAKLFRATADAETIHALKEFELAGMVKSTDENLQDAISGETYEFQDMYPPFVEQAQADGNRQAATAMNYALQAEEVHAVLFQEALDHPDESEEQFYYLCPLCGNIEKERPDRCIICGVMGDRFTKY